MNPGSRFIASWKPLAPSFSGQGSMSRPSWDLYFAASSFMAAAQQRAIGPGWGPCWLALTEYVLATGFNGAKPGEPHCDEVGHDMVGNHCRRTVHAERNAIVQARLREAGLHTMEGATIYTSHKPCIDCARLISFSGITRVVYVMEYSDGEKHSLPGAIRPGSLQARAHRRLSGDQLARMADCQSLPEGAGVMALEKCIFVRCDACGYCTSFRHDAKTARKEAKRAGWVRRKNKAGESIDVCAQCSRFDNWQDL